LLTSQTESPALKSGEGIVTPARDPIAIRVLLILFTIAVTVAAATLLARW
jgi:hypothetical protein